MVSLNITIKQGKKKNKKIVEFDADQLERLASVLGMFNPNFLKSLAKSEKDYKEGRYFKINSLKDLEKQWRFFRRYGLRLNMANCP